MVHRTSWTIRISAAVVVAGTASVLGVVSAAAAPTVAPAQWKPCPDTVFENFPDADRSRFGCATVAVPLDYADPGAGTVPIAVLRRAADDPAHRIGTLFLNPGGPGSAGLTMPLGDTDRLSPEIVARFDLIGFDPRGVGASMPLSCFTSQDDADRVTGALSDPDTATVLAASAAYGDACRRNAGPLIGHLSTLDVARDLDVLRQSVGEDRISYAGFSYGTYLGALYAHRYGAHLRAMVLDGNVDPVLRSSDGLEYNRERAVSFHQSFTAFLGECAKAGAACAFSAGDPAAKVDAITARLRRGPVRLGGTELTYLMFVRGVGQSLYDPATFPALAEQLQQIYQAAQAQPRATEHDAPATPYAPNGDEAGRTVNCVDQPLPRVPRLYPAVAESWERQAPLFGRGSALDLVPCATWPTNDAERYQGSFRSSAATPVLLFGNAHDPATPLVFAEGMQRALGSAVLVRTTAFGHMILRRSACATAIASRYLVDLVVPDRNQVCAPDRPPFPAR